MGVGLESDAVSTQWGAMGARYYLRPYRIANGTGQRRHGERPEWVVSGKWPSEGFPAAAHRRALIPYTAQAVSECAQGIDYKTHLEWA